MKIILLLILLLQGCSNIQRKEGSKYLIISDEWFSEFDDDLELIEFKDQCNTSRSARKVINEIHEKLIVNKNYQRSFKVYYTLSNCYLLSKNYFQAEFYYKISLELAKTNKEKSAIYNNIGVIYSVHENILLSMDFFKRSIELRSSEVNVYNFYQLSSQFNQFHNFESLIKYVERLSLEVDHAKLLLANYYFYSQNLTKANSYYSALQLNFLKNKKGLDNYIWTLIGLSDQAKAKEIYEDYGKYLSTKRNVSKVLKNANAK